jgi:hypothetical protein
MTDIREILTSTSLGTLVLVMPFFIYNYYHPTKNIKWDILNIVFLILLILVNIVGLYIFVAHILRLFGIYIWPERDPAKTSKPSTPNPPNSPKPFEPPPHSPKPLNEIWI